MIKPKQLVYCLLPLFASLTASRMAAGNNDTENNVLEWVKTDNRRFLNAVIRVGDLNRTIEFYTQCFGMELLSKKDIPEKNYTIAAVGYGSPLSHFVLKLIYIQGVEKYEVGKAFGHFGIASQDIYPIVEKVGAFGGVITLEPVTMNVGSQVILFAFVEDPNGYSFELLQRGPTPEPLCQIMLNVLDLNRSISFYEKALGMNLLQTYDSPQDQFAYAMVGYGSDETQTTVIELMYNYSISSYTEGYGYVQLAIGTDDVYKSAAAVKLVTEELGGVIIWPPGPDPISNTKITSFLDPDGFTTVLVDSEDYLREVQKEH